MSEPLTREQVAGLAVGTPVLITWSGGNGPHRYTIAVKWGCVIAATTDELKRDRLDIQKALTGPGAFVGTERFHTRVWLAEPVG